MNNYQTIFDGAMLIIVVVAAVATWQNSKQARQSSEETDALTTIKIKDAAILALQQETDRLNKLVIQDGKDIAVLKSEKERLEALVQNRNPELEKFMRETSASILLIESSIQTLLKMHQAASTVPSVTVNNTK